MLSTTPADKIVRLADADNSPAVVADVSRLFAAATAVGLRRSPSPVLGVSRGASRDSPERRLTAVGRPPTRAEFGGGLSPAASCVGGLLRRIIGGSRRHILRRHVAVFVIVVPPRPPSWRIRDVIANRRKLRVRPDDWRCAVLRRSDVQRRCRFLGPADNPAPTAPAGLRQQ